MTGRSPAGHPEGANGPGRVGPSGGIPSGSTGAPSHRSAAGSADPHGVRFGPPSGPFPPPSPGFPGRAPARAAGAPSGLPVSGMNGSPTSALGPALGRAAIPRAPETALQWPPPGQQPNGDGYPFAGPPGRGSVDPRVSIVPRPIQPSPLSGPITQPTVMLRPFDPPPPGSILPPETGREAFVDIQPDHDESHSSGPSLVRPYARTGGRTKPGRDLALEALVSTTVSGRDAWQSPMLTPEHASVIELCSGTVSVAEIAARLAVPLGVARVIIADMVDLGLVEVMRTSSGVGDERDPAFLRRVLSGLQRL